MRLDKIYTKTGDAGTTFLADGEKVSKCSLRISAYGTIDELNSFVGLLKDELSLDLPQLESVKVVAALRMIQNELFDLGGELATANSTIAQGRQKLVGQKEVNRLEHEMDEWTAILPALENFVLPGGCRGNSLAHICRTVCRRAERELVELASNETIRGECQIYINRLSDWFFVLSRFISSLKGKPEELWQQRR